ncbi:hypothetical protein Tco_1159128 [Tanacetum coccineum]
MDTTKAHQKALDDALVTPENHLKIGKCNQRLSPTLKSNQPTIQVALDALKLTPFYNAFEVSADVPKIYMQEFWATVTKHHFSLRFKMNGKSHTVNVDNFRDILNIFPKLPGQKFEDPPFEEEILSFIRDLGHTGEIKVLFDVNVNHLHQPWRSFAAIINKCLSGKTTALEMYQVENKNSKKNNDMYYPRFVIVDYFMAKDQAIPRRNKMFWHSARDDFMFTTIRIPKPKKKSTQASKGKRIKTTAKVATSRKKRQSAKTSKAKGLTVLSEIALSEAKQMKLAIERSKTQTHNSHASDLGSDEGTGVIPGVPDVPTYDSNDEQISWKSSDEEDDNEVGMNDDDNDNDDDDDDQEHDNQDDDDQEHDNQDDDDQEHDNQDNDDQEHDGQDDEEQDDVNEQTDSDNDGDDFVHPKLSTYDEEDKEEYDSNPRVHTPSNYESTDDEESDEEIQGANVDGNEMDDEETNEEEKSTSLVDVLVTTIVETPLSSATTLPPPPTPLTLHLQQKPVPIPATVPSSSLQDIPNFGSLFEFDHRLKTLKIDFLEFKQTNQFATAVSSIPGIVDKYLTNKMNDGVNTAVQLQSNKLKEEPQVENDEFLNKIDSNIKAIIKD